MEKLWTYNVEIMVFTGLMCLLLQVILLNKAVAGSLI